MREFCAPSTHIRACEGHTCPSHIPHILEHGVRPNPVSGFSRHDCRNELLHNEISLSLLCADKGAPSLWWPPLMNNSRLPSTGSGCTPFHPPASHNNREDCKVLRLRAAIKLMPLSVSLFLILSFGSLLMVAHSQPGAGDDVVHDPFLGEVSELIERYGDVMLPALSYVEHTAAWWERRHENALEMYHREAVNGAEEEEGSSNNDGGLVGEVGSCIGWRQTADCSPHGSRQPHLDQGCQATIAGGASGYCLCARPQQARQTHGKVPHWRGPGVGCNHVPFTCEAMCALHRDKASERDVLTVYDALQRDSSGGDVSPTKDGGVEGENVRSSLGGGDGGLEEGAAIEIPAVDVAAARRRFESRYGFLVTDEFEVISKEATVVPGGAAGGATSGDSSPTFLSERRLWQSSLDGTPFELFPRRRMLHRYLGHSEERARRTTMMARIREALSVRSGSSLTALGATAGMPPSFVKEVFHNAESEASSSPPVGRSSSPMESIVDVRRRLEMEASLRRLHRAIHHQAEQKATDAAHHADRTLPAKRGHLDLPHQHSADDTEDVFHALREFEVEYNLPYRGSLEEGTAAGAVDGSDLERDGVDVGGGKQDDRRGGSSGPLRHLQQAWDHIKQTALKDISAAASHLNHLLLVGNTTFEHGWNNNDGGDKDARYDLPSLRKLSLIDALLLASALDIGSADVESEIDNIVFSRSEYGEEIARSRFRFVNGSVGRRAEVGGHRRAGRPIGSFNPKQELAEHIAAHCGGNEEGRMGGHSGSRQDTDFAPQELVRSTCQTDAALATRGILQAGATSRKRPRGTVVPGPIFSTMSSTTAVYPCPSTTVASQSDNPISAPMFTCLQLSMVRIPSPWTTLWITCSLEASACIDGSDDV